MERIRRSKKRNYTIIIILSALILTVGYATFAQPLAHKLATILPDNSRFGLWGGIINTGADNNKNKNTNKVTPNKNNQNNNYQQNNNIDNNTNNDNSSSNISNKQWDIGFIDAKKVNTFGNAKENSPVSFNKLFATFDVLFKESGDSITYEFTVKNKGELDAKLDGYDVITTNEDNFRFSVDGLIEDEALDVGKTKTIKVKATYIGNPDDNSNNEGGKIVIALRYVQK